MDQEVTVASLATVAGSSVAVIALVQFVKLFANLTDRQSRQLAAILGLVLVEVAILILNGLDWLALFLGLIVGVQAGLAASKAKEIVQKGLDHVVQRAT
jgi:hypothetical protein